MVGGRWTALVWLPLGAGLICPPPAAAHGPARTDGPPRKVVIGTVVQAFWGEYPGLEQRLLQLEKAVTEMAAEARRKYSRGLDLAVLPEVAVTGGRKGNAAQRSVAFEGPVKDAFAALARRLKCHIVVPLDLAEGGRYYNAAVMVGRKGETLGIYRKLHPAVRHGTEDMEGGMSPGREAPVFHCDFGRVGVQICFDMEFDRGWQELEGRGAEVVAWPTQSPQTAHPAFRAMQHRCYIVSSTWRNNAAIFEPTGKILGQVRPPQRVLVEQVDLSYMVLPWAPQLNNGAGLKEKYGGRLGFRYYEDEDCGIFWSNDSRLTIGAMARSIGLTDWFEEHSRLRVFFARQRGKESGR